MFNAEEIFNIGIQIEKNGHDFYQAAIEKTDEDQLKTLFRELANWESKHVEIFENLRTKLPEAVKTTDVYDQENLVHLYLKAVADNEIFVKGQEISIEECDTPYQILKTALGFEKESVVLYTSMKEMVSEDLGKSAIDKLINEELHHIGQLTKELKELRK